MRTNSIRTSEFSGPTERKLPTYLIGGWPEGWGGGTSNFSFEREACLKGGLDSTWIGLLELPRLDFSPFERSPICTECAGTWEVAEASTGLDLALFGTDCPRSPWPALELESSPRSTVCAGTREVLWSFGNDSPRSSWSALERLIAGVLLKWTLDALKYSPRFSLNR